jgi:hypothetical protein
VRICPDSDRDCCPLRPLCSLDRLQPGLNVPAGYPSGRAERFLVRSNDRVLRIARHAKLGNVETFFFHLRRYPHAFRFVDAPEHSVGCTERPDGVQGCSHELTPELAGIAVEQAGHALAGSPQVGRCSYAIPSRTINPVGKDSDADRPEPSALTMHRNRTTGIIDLENPLIEEHAAANQASRQYADD